MFHQGPQTRENSYKHEADGQVLSLSLSVKKSLRRDGARVLKWFWRLDLIGFCTGFVDWFQTLFSWRNIKLSRCMWLKYGHTIGLSPYELLIILRMSRLHPQTFHCLSSNFRLPSIIIFARATRFSEQSCSTCGM